MQFYGELPSPPEYPKVVSSLGIDPTQYSITGNDGKVSIPVKAAGMPNITQKTRAACLELRPHTTPPPRLEERIDHDNGTITLRMYGLSDPPDINKELGPFCVNIGIDLRKYEKPIVKPVSHEVYFPMSADGKRL